VSIERPPAHINIKTMAKIPIVDMAELGIMLYETIFIADNILKDT